MAWLVGVRKSKIRLSSLVSWLTLMLSPSSDSSSAVTLRLASSICNGNWGSEAETTQICLTWSSTSFCVQPSTFSGDFLTSAWTSTMLSLEILQKKEKKKFKKYINHNALNDCEHYSIIVTIMCRNDELSSKMSWVGCLLTDSGLSGTWK